MITPLHKGMYQGQSVYVTGKTGKKLPAVLVGASNQKARVRMYHKSTNTLGSIQSYDWELIEQAERDHFVTFT